MQGGKIEAWFVLQANREYFGVECTALLSANKFKKKIYPLVRWAVKYLCFFISEAIKIAASFSKLQCLYAMLLLWDNSKHGFSVA